jgi:MFS family permease
VLEVLKGILSGTVGALLWYSFIRGISSSLLMTFLSLYANSLGYSLVDIGFFSMVGSAVSVLMLPFVGFVADVYGRKPVAITSGVLMGLSPIIPIMLPNYLGLLIGYALFYSSFMVWQPARGAMVTDVVSEGELGAVFARISTAFTLARIITPYIAGVTIVYAGYGIVFLITSGMTLIATAAFAFLTKETIAEKKERSIDIRVLEEFMKSLIPRRDELKLHTVLSIDRVGWRLWIPLLSPYLKTTFGLDEGAVGALTTLRSISQLLLLHLAGQFVDKYGYVKALAISEIFGLATVACLVIKGSIIAPAIAMAAMGASIAFWIPSYNVVTAKTAKTPEERARIYSKVNMYRTTASIPMPWIGGTLSNIVMILPFITSAALLTANTFLILGLLREQ